MYVIIGGGRDLPWRFEYDAYLDRLHARYQFAEVIVGSNIRDHKGRRKGADAHAKGWAERAGINTTVMDANWVGQGRSGGPRRNTRMLHYLDLLTDTTEAPGLVIAFPGGSGTDDLCTQAAACGIPVLRYPDLPPTREGA
jgi:hypothetical protein